MKKVLIVEDEEAMAVALCDGFESDGYEVERVRDGETALGAIRTVRPDIVILDLMLPKLGGLDVCRTIRKDGNAVPVIMLTARGQEIDKVVGLKVGADDYVTKPFSLMELLARVEAVLRRVQGAAGGSDGCKFGDVRIDFRGSEATKGGRALALTALEFRLLRYFNENAGVVIAREQLLRDVWGYENATITRTVDMHIAKLRKKVEDKPKDPRHIVTIHGQGYKFRFD